MKIKKRLTPDYIELKQDKLTRESLKNDKEDLKLNDSLKSVL